MITTSSSFTDNLAQTATKTKKNKKSTRERSKRARRSSQQRQRRRRHSSRSSLQAWESDDNSDEVGDEDAAAASAAELDSPEESSDERRNRRRKKKKKRDKENVETFVNTAAAASAAIPVDAGTKVAMAESVLPTEDMAKSQAVYVVFKPKSISVTRSLESVLSPNTPVIYKVDQQAQAVSSHEHSLVKSHSVRIDNDEGQASNELYVVNSDTLLGTRTVACSPKQLAQLSPSCISTIIYPTQLSLAPRSKSQPAPPAPVVTVVSANPKLSKTTTPGMSPFAELSDEKWRNSQRRKKHRDRSLKRKKDKDEDEDYDEEEEEEADRRHRRHRRSSKKEKRRKRTERQSSRKERSFRRDRNRSSKRRVAYYD